MKSAIRYCIFLTAVAAAVTPAQQSWRPAGSHIMTRWAKNVSPATAWREYPRPQLVRELWLNLNGSWDYAVTGEPGPWPKRRVENASADLLSNENLQPPKRWDGKILVPFAIESALSGVEKLVRPNQMLWYRRAFETPRAWRGRRVLLNFDAVDWHAVIFVNGRRVGEHKGGYTRFAADVTPALHATGAQELVVAVWDPTNAGDQALGKQSLPEMRQGYRYTSTTGIWQTVWLEAAPAIHIEGLRIQPDVDKSEVSTTVSAGGKGRVRVTVLDGARQVATAQGAAGEPIRIPLASPRLWTPERPFLYNLRVTLSSGADTDTVTSYFAMRKIAIQAGDRGIARYFLNNQPLRFQFGPLDQGYWPDGGLTPPSDQAAEFDLQYLKDIGCNMVRVHENVHPERWYYHADRLGLLVWQDMVCTRKFESKITPPSAEQWEAEQRAMIAQLRNHPSIIQWTVFNEGWGQYDTERLVKWTRALDATRVIDAASGWTDTPGLGDVRDIHDYSFFPSMPSAESEKARAMVLGETGGFDLLIPGHMWNPEQQVKTASDASRNLGREKYANPGQLLARYRDWVGAWRYLAAQFGLSAAVYTQISDVEHEPNGWLTYDREVSKIPVAELKAIHQLLYAGAPAFSTLARVEDGGEAGKEIHLRRTVTLPAKPVRPALIVFQAPGTVQFAVNGATVMSTANRGTRYGTGISVIPLAAKPDVFRKGANEIAVDGTFTETPSRFRFDIVDLGR